jgi:hypothetical protein
MKLQHGRNATASAAAPRVGALRLACACGLMLVVAATVSWSFEDTETVGLAGILPEEVPAGLGDDDWAVLDGNWAEWSDGTAAAVADLYTGELADVDAQRAAIATLRVKLGTMAKSLADSKYAIIHDKLANLHGRLARRVDVAEAVLNTLEADLAGAKAARTAAAYQSVAGALDALKSDVAAIPGGNAWLPYVRAEQLAAAAAANDTSEDAVTLLTAVKGKIDGRAALSAEQAEFLGRQSFLELATAIDGVVIASAWAPPENYQARVREESQKLLTALEAYEIDANRAAANEAEQAYQALNEIAADGGAGITAAMRRHYFNYNVRIIASEGLMNRFAGDTKREQSPISEAVSGAWVSGTSYTTTNVGIDLKPGTDAALFDVVVRGNVQSSTVASASQQGVNANIWGGSTGSFEGRRPVTFDGKSFQLGATSVAVNASTYASSAQTDAFFLIRGIANSMALGQAQSRRGQSDAYARQKIRDQVTQEMGSQSTSKFENANVELEAKLYGPLRELGWHPDQIQLSSTETALAAQARLMNPDELGAQAPALVPAPPAKGVVIQVHESLLNNGADRLDIAGKTMSDAELKQLIEERISKLLGREFKFSKPGEAAPPQPAATAAEGQPAEEELPDESGKMNTYVFDTHDPLRFQVDNGTLTIILRTGLKREGGEEIPTHEIEVPLSFSIEGGQVVMKRAGSVRVVPGGPEVPRSIPRQQIMRANIQNSIPERTFKGSFDVSQQDKTITLNVTGISAGDGWVTVTAE